MKNLIKTLTFLLLFTTLSKKTIYADTIPVIKMRQKIKILKAQKANIEEKRKIIDASKRKIELLKIKKEIYYIYTLAYEKDNEGKSVFRALASEVKNIIDKALNDLVKEEEKRKQAEAESKLKEEQERLRIAREAEQRQQAEQERKRREELQKAEAERNRRESDNMARFEKVTEVIEIAKSAKALKISKNKEKRQLDKSPRRLNVEEVNQIEAEDQSNAFQMAANEIEKEQEIQNTKPKKNIASPFLKKAIRNSASSKKNKTKEKENKQTGIKKPTKTKEQKANVEATQKKEIVSKTKTSDSTINLESNDQVTKDKGEHKAPKLSSKPKTVAVYKLGRSLKDPEIKPDYNQIFEDMYAPNQTPEQKRLLMRKLGCIKGRQLGGRKLILLKQRKLTRLESICRKKAKYGAITKVKKNTNFFKPQAKQIIGEKLDFSKNAELILPPIELFDSQKNVGSIDNKQNALVPDYKPEKLKFVDFKKLDIDFSLIAKFIKKLSLFEINTFKYNKEIFVVIQPNTTPKAICSSQETGKENSMQLLVKLPQEKTSELVRALTQLALALKKPILAIDDKAHNEPGNNEFYDDNKNDTSVDESDANSDINVMEMYLYSMKVGDEVSATCYLVELLEDQESPFDIIQQMLNFALKYLDTKVVYNVLLTINEELNALKIAYKLSIMLEDLVTDADISEGIATRLTKLTTILAKAPKKTKAYRTWQKVYNLTKKY